MDPMVAASIGAGTVILCIGSGVLIGWGWWGRDVARAKAERDAAVEAAKAREETAEEWAQGSAEDYRRAADRLAAGDDPELVLRAAFGKPAPDPGEPGDETGLEGA